jgi:hypothetical protein
VRKVTREKKPLPRYLRGGRPEGRGCPYPTDSADHPTPPSTTISRWRRGESRPRTRANFREANVPIRVPAFLEQEVVFFYYYFFFDFLWFSFACLSRFLFLSYWRWARYREPPHARFKVFAFHSTEYGITVKLGYRM